MAVDYDLLLCKWTPLVQLQKRWASDSSAWNAGLNPQSGKLYKLEDSLDKILSMCNQLEMFSADSNLGTSNTPV